MSIHTPREYVNAHRALGHEAEVTVIAAPGTGTGSYCFTCNQEGPSNGRILSLDEVV